MSLAKLIFKKYSIVRKIVSLTSTILFLRKEITGRNNQVKITNSLFKNVKIKVQGNHNQIIFENDARIYNLTINLHGDNHKIYIKEKCRLKGGTFWFEDAENTLIIAEGTTIEEVSISLIGHKKTISIGRDCMFSEAIQIRNGDSHSIIDLETSKKINIETDVYIGNHVWIGSNVIILKGVNIPDNCIVATGSIVTNSLYLNNTIIGGNTAKTIKHNIDWKRERFLDE